MKTRKGALVALLLLATCTQESLDTSSPPESPKQPKLALGKIPASEVAVWQKVGSSTVPDGRYLQAAAFDSARKVVVMFGGINLDPTTGATAANQETWEWNPASGKWTNRTGTGTMPSARSGAAMVYDSKRAKMILFGGRAGSGYNYEDTWEWDPGAGTWTDLTNAGSHPSARSQHGMVYEASTGKVLLFGGGRSDPGSYDGTGVTVSLGDTWELDPTTHAWTALTPAATPSSRFDMGLVWDGSRNKAVLFGGMQQESSGVTGVAKQDTWEWDPSAATWTERTTAGTKPTPRYAHSMAFDGNRGKVLVFGGFDMSTGGSLNDLWEWDPTTAAWSERMTGTETGVPSDRRYASMLSNDATGKLYLIAGASANTDPYGKGGTGGIIIIGPIPVYYGTTGTREVWELDPTTPAFTDRTAVLDVPAARSGHAMAFYPPLAKVFVFGGMDQMTGRYFNDFWSWDGTTWSQVTGSETPPPARTSAALAYDPARKSLILYGGSSNNGYASDTWEWSPSRGWTQLTPATNPGALSGHGMVTDTARSKILLFGGLSMGSRSADAGPPIYYLPPSMPSDVWEWDGATISWTNRTLTTSGSVPSGRQAPSLAYDEGQGKLFLAEGSDRGYTMGTYWEWDPTSAGWAMRNTGDTSANGSALLATYDSIRRREVLVAQTYDYSVGSSQDQTWEIDARNTTLYARSPNPSPGARYNSAMTFDSGRGVVVLFSGQTTSGGVVNDTWEYKVTGLGNGEGCTSAQASACASGYCVEGVCCASAACSGPCKSCNVTGSEGTCVPAKAGTEVPGSCANGQACDGNGACMASNGQACASSATCASGACVDGVCCESPCTGTCMSCSQAGSEGKCRPYPAGSDPQNECGKGTGLCKSTCNGVDGCGFPQSNVSCGTCMYCDGAGTCYSDPYCGSYGGKPIPPPFGTGGVRPYPTGGTGGSPYSSGGSSYPSSSGGAGGITIPRTGTGGFVATGGSAIGRGGSIPPVGGFAGAGNTSTGRGGTIAVAGSFGYGGSGGSGGGVSRGGSFGYGGTLLGSGGTSGSGGKRDAGASGGKSNGTATQAVDLNTHLHAGCGCALGTASPKPTLTSSLLALVLGLLWTRSRRRKHGQ